MERIRAFELKNKGLFVVRLRVKNSDGASITSGNILSGKSLIIDLNQHLDKINDGDTVWVEAVVVGGKNRTSSKKYIYRAGALEKAKYEIKGLPMSNNLKFIGTETAYEYHFFYDEDNPHKINGITYVLIPEESIAIVHPNGYEYEGTVKIPSTIKYQGKKYVVTEIGKTAFYCCQELKSLTLPASICYISDFIVKDCDMLTTIRVQTDTPPEVEAHGFQEFNKDKCTLYVPLGCTEIYRNTYYWDQFKNIKAYWNKPIIDRINKDILKIRGVKNPRIKPEQPQKE